jgi:hypothetical protein
MANCWEGEASRSSHFLPFSLRSHPHATATITIFVLPPSLPSPHLVYVVPQLLGSPQVPRHLGPRAPVPDVGRRVRMGTGGRAGKGGRKGRRRGGGMSINVCVCVRVRECVCVSVDVRTFVFAEVGGDGAPDVTYRLGRHAVHGRDA